MKSKANSLDHFEVGMEIGRLTVRERVRDIIHHPSYPDTKTSYLNQGKIHECACTCGRIVLLSEAILRSNRIQSCGCLRQENNQKSWVKKQKRLLLYVNIKEFEHRRLMAKDLFFLLRQAPHASRNEAKLLELAKEMNHWKAMKIATKRQLNKLDKNQKALDK